MHHNDVFLSRAIRFTFFNFSCKEAVSSFASFGCWKKMDIFQNIDCKRITANGP